MVRKRRPPSILLMRMAMGAIVSMMVFTQYVFIARAESEGLEEAISTWYGTAPNIIIINADDLGYGDLSCFDSKAISTPSLDRMAGEGMRFTDFYVCSPVCSPSRYGLLTGRYPVRIDLNQALMPSNAPVAKRMEESFYRAIGKLGLIDLGDAGDAHGIPQEDVTLAEALREAGYRTCLIGKWHLGDTPEFHPRKHGFDYFFGVPYSNDMVPFPLYRNEEVLEEEIEDQGTLTKQYTDQALQFIEDAKNERFFLYFAHTFPHVPLHASDDFRGKSRGGLYGDTVEEIDWSVGKLLEKLDESGLAERTLIFFTSDNGPWYEGSPGGLRGGKGLTFEGGFRVPMIARWSGHVPAASVCNEMAANIDFFPTCLALAGVALPGGRIIDGKDIAPLLAGNGKTPHEAIYFYRWDKGEAIRVGKWKYHRRRNVYIWPSNLQTKGPWLFDMESDPHERYDVSETYPEIAEQLESMLAGWDNRVKK